MRNPLVIVSLPMLVACATDNAETGADPQVDASVRVSGTFAGHYEVPIAPALGAAATFPMDDVDWTVIGDTATLHYDLPMGLVGGELSITLSGPIDDATGTVALSGPVGTGTCTIEGSILSCREVFENLGPLPISLAVVEAYARMEYTGPVADRVRVANMFASEPVGIVAFDLAVPVSDDDEPDEPDDD